MSDIDLQIKSTEKIIWKTMQEDVKSGVVSYVTLQSLLNERDHLIYQSVYGTKSRYERVVENGT